jgi:iron(II)-dependent oxidoreductase
MKRSRKTRRHFSPAVIILLIICVFFLPASVLAEPAPPPGMVYIPEGYFQMGASHGKDDEKPMHFVNTSAYFIDKYEVSNADYMEFVEATGHEKPKLWNDENFNAPEFPVVGISWHDAMAYAQWKGHRLPTEAEWEKAARGNDGRLWPWGNKLEKGFFTYFVNIFGDDDNYPRTAPVTYYESGASPFGLFNTAGNVWEWCLDWYDKDYYRASPEFDPQGPEGPKKSKVLRGGSWVNDLDGVQVIRRAHNFPHIQNEIYGFRTVLPLP